jgi:hypothetical protein
MELEGRLQVRPEDEVLDSRCQVRACPVRHLLERIELTDLREGRTSSGAAGMAQAMLKRAADVGDFHPAAHGFLID